MKETERERENKRDGESKKREKERENSRNLERERKKKEREGCSPNTTFRLRSSWFVLFL